MDTPLVETVGLTKHFKTPHGLLHAIDKVDLKIGPCRTLGVVGESGCGKSTLGRTVLGLQAPTSGEVYFEGKSILGYRRKQMKAVHRDMQMIFQDPYSSLDPRMSIFDLIAEPLRELCGRELSRAEVQERVLDIMELCGLPRRYANSYPHELDGGRRQRVGLARAMVIEPKFIVCDEPVSALDVSIQAQILNLLMDLQEERGLSYMFITHDLCVVRHIRRYNGHVYGRSGGTGAEGRAFPRSAAPVYAGSALRNTDNRPEQERQAAPYAERGGILAHRPAAWLPLRSALPLCGGALQGRVRAP